MAQDGTYELFTKGKPGAAPGAYKVTIAAQPVVDSTKPLEAKSLVPQEYTTKETTPLAVQVVATPGTAYDLEVK